MSQKSSASSAWLGVIAGLAFLGMMYGAARRGCERQHGGGGANAGRVASAGPFAAAGTPKRASVGDHGYSLVLPPGWSRQPRPEGAADVFQAADDSAQLTVSVMPATTPMDKVTRASTAAEILRLRRDSERKAMGSRMTVTEPHQETRGDVETARYEGTEPDAKQRFAELVEVSPAGVWVFFVEVNDSLTEAEALAGANGMFDSVTVSQSLAGAAPDPSAP